MNTPSNNQPLNPAQNQHIIALAASVSKSMRTSVILLVLAAARLGQRADDPKQLAGLTCRQIFEWVKRTPYGCSYEAVRKLLKHLVRTGVAEFCCERYILADSVATSLRGLSDPLGNGTVGASTVMAETGARSGTGNPQSQSGNSLPNSDPGGAVATPFAPAATADDEINKKAIEHFVDIAAYRSFAPRSSLYWQISCCHIGSLAQLAAAASGLATALMSNMWFFSPIGELQAILDGKSAIKPTSPASFVFAYEASTREGAAEAKAKAIAPFVNKAFEMLEQRLAQQKAAAAIVAQVQSADASASPQDEEQHPLAIIYQLPLQGDYGHAA